MPTKIVPDEAQTYIVSRLACFASPSVVIEEVREEWKVKLSTAALAHYNPTTVQGRDLSQELKDLFHATREEYRKGVMDVGIANQRNRLERLDRIANQAWADGLSRLEMDAVKQAREETTSSSRPTNAPESAGDTPQSDAPSADFKARVEELKQKTPNELADIYTSHIVS